MKTSAVVVLVGAFTIAGGLAVMNKACKTKSLPLVSSGVLREEREGAKPWCTDASARATRCTSRLGSGFLSLSRGPSGCGLIALSNAWRLGACCAAPLLLLSRQVDDLRA